VKFLHVSNAMNLFGKMLLLCLIGSGLFLCEIELPKLCISFLSLHRKFLQTSGLKHLTFVSPNFYASEVQE
jgi:hypothetical protein